MKVIPVIASYEVFYFRFNTPRDPDNILPYISFLLAQNIFDRFANFQIWNGNWAENKDKMYVKIK